MTKNYFAVEGSKRKRLLSLSPLGASSLLLALFAFTVCTASSGMAAATDCTTTSSEYEIDDWAKCTVMETYCPSIDKDHVERCETCYIRMFDLYFNPYDNRCLSLPLTPPRTILIPGKYERARRHYERNRQRTNPSRMR
jgi:hypothetical protein